jgi:hypothetical protein
MLGSTIVMPYYGLKDPSTSHSDIDSANFITKTKAALSYYEGKILSNYVYYVGEKELRKVYENNEAEQKDTANFIELVAASALFDFLKRDKPEQTQYMTRAIEENSESLDKDKLGSGYNELVKAVADFNLFVKLAHTLPTEKYFPLIMDRKFNKEFYNDQAYSSLKSFIDMYENWYNELATNNRAFAPLNTETPDLSQFVKCMSLDAKDDSYYLLQMIKYSNEDKKDNHSNRFRYFLDFAYSAINHYTSKILS